MKSNYLRKDCAKSLFYKGFFAQSVTVWIISQELDLKRPLAQSIALQIISTTELTCRFWSAAEKRSGGAA
jgi:hypothetical protein